MKKIVLFFVLLSTISVKAQLVSNIRAMQQDTTLVIVYDLQAPATTELQVSLNGGVTFIPVAAVSGDIDKTNAGNNRIVYWNATKDIGYFDCDKMVFKIIASNRTSYEANAVPGHHLSYNHRRVYQQGNDVTNDYHNFLRNNCTDAYKAYERRKNGMLFGGAAITLSAIPFIFGGATSPTEWGTGACFGMMSVALLTGIPMMGCSTIAARKYSVKVYNNSCGSLNASALGHISKREKTPLQLSWGMTGQGLGMVLHF